jgi:hypothetical protein
VPYFTHGFNFLLMLLDAFINQQPVLLLHGVYFTFYIAVYAVFFGVWNLETARELYGIKLWTHGLVIGPVISVLFVVLVCPLVMVLMWYWWTSRVGTGGRHAVYYRVGGPGAPPIEQLADKELNLDGKLTVEFGLTNLDFDEHTTKGRLDLTRAFGESSRACLRGRSGRRAFIALRALLMLACAALLAWSRGRWTAFQAEHCVPIHANSTGGGSGSSYFGGALTFAYERGDNCDPWGAYLTHWTLVLECLYLTFACGATLGLASRMAAEEAADARAAAEHEHGAAMGDGPIDPTASAVQYTPSRKARKKSQLLAAADAVAKPSKIAV